MVLQGMLDSSSFLLFWKKILSQYSYFLIAHKVVDASSMLTDVCVV